MNPTLIEQIIQLISWGMTGLLSLKENDASNAAFIPALRAALAENRPLTAEEWAPIQAAVDAAHTGLQNA